MDTDKLPSRLHPVTSICFSNSSKDNPFHLDSRSSEIQQQANSKTRRLQIVQTLGLMDLIQFRHRFQFNEDTIFYEQVSDVIAGDNSVTSNGYGMLLDDPHSDLAQFMGKSILVHLLQEAMTERFSHTVG